VPVQPFNWSTFNSQLSFPAIYFSVRFLSAFGTGNAQPAPIKGRKTTKNRPSNNMKKFITVWISCSLALAAGAMAQQDEATPAPKKKQHEKAQGSPEGRPAAKPQAERPASQPRPGKRKEATAPENAKPETSAGEQPVAPPKANAQPGQHKKGPRAGKATETPSANAAPAAAVTPAPVKANAKAQAQASAAPQPNQPQPPVPNKPIAQGKKPDASMPSLNRSKSQPSPLPRTAG
jgi:hypothetical protein